MTDHLPDAPVSNERLEHLIQFIEQRPDLISFDVTPAWADPDDWSEDLKKALLEFKTLREQCEQQQKLLARALPDLKWAEGAAYNEFNADLDDPEIIRDIEQCLSGSAESKQ